MSSQDLATRMERLERSNRLYRRAMFVTVGLVLALAAVTTQRALAAAGGPISATEFILTDNQGHARGYLGFDNDGAPMLALYGTVAVEPPLAMFKGKPDGTVTLALGRPALSGHVLAGTSPTGAFLALDHAVQPGVFTYVGSSGAGAVELYDGSGNMTWSAP